ncbi:Hypothetical protein ETEE_0792 [Edwardsiella anguillarum ET080813]|uniref:Uncharacterized protein n=1 Tax=Edwardsiella anguillarum ET080813 TaxID=667120 RepID=A0A076LKL7_9GAMM|nr:Hypothetical protein ETEE_0792 [Edwardsiella anguillarum ET080813]
MKINLYITCEGRFYFNLLSINALRDNLINKIQPSTVILSNLFVALK